MVNPVAKYKAWDAASTSMTGTTSDDYWPALEAELDAWITAISGNASMTGKVPIKRKGYADSTSASYLGFTLELPHPTYPSIYLGSYLASSTGTSRARRQSETWSDDGGNGGYGTFSGVNDVESGSIAGDGFASGIFLAYDTTDTKEFFIAGHWDSASESNHDNIVSIMMGVHGGWGSFINDATVNHVLWHNPNSGSTSSVTAPVSSSFLPPFQSQNSGSGYIGTGVAFTCANTRVLQPNSVAKTGNYLGDSPYSAYGTAYYGQVVVVGS